MKSLFARPIRSAALAITLVALAASPALAQSEDGGDEGVSGDIADPDNEPRRVYKSRTELDMDGAAIDAGLRSPLGAMSLSLRESTFNPLVKLKADFDAEMVESVTLVR